MDLFAGAEVVKADSARALSVEGGRTLQILDSQTNQALLYRMLFEHVWNLRFLKMKVAAREHYRT